MSALLISIVALFVSVGMFLLMCYFMMLTYNFSVPTLFTFARQSEDYWKFVVFAIFLVIVGAFFSPVAGVLGGINNQRIFRYRK